MHTILDADDGRECRLSPCGVLSPTKDEVATGTILGNAIDSWDDEDNGITDVGAKTLLSRSLSGRDSALAKARELKRVMLDYGVPEVSIELQEGRPSGYPNDWDCLFVVSDMSHHTVSAYSVNSLTPVLSLCKRGRSDLPGPLCNGYGGWDLCYRILTFGFANHPGYGGPLTIPALTAGTFTIPKDSARRYTWGTEWEGGIRNSDWDRVLTNPRNGMRMSFREFMGRCNAALEEYHQIHEYAHLEHSTWTSRKIDRLQYSASRGISEKEPYRKTRKDWFDMATVDDLQKAVRMTPIHVGQDDNGKAIEWPLQKVLRHLLNTQVDPTALADAIVNHLPQGGSSLTADQIQAAAERAVRDVLGSLDK